MKTVVTSPDAPAALGPYSQDIAAGSLFFCSGQVPIDPQTGELVDGGIRAQTQRVLQNLAAVLGAHGLEPGDVVKTTVFMTDLSRFAEMNTVYGAFFRDNFPARSTVQVAALPKGAQVEIEVIALQRS